MSHHNIRGTLTYRNIPGTLPYRRAPAGTRITSVQARGTGTLTYSVVSVHEKPSVDMFEVDADGQLILAKSLDREAADR